MRNCFIYDHVRTPRGKGKPNGSLHRISPVELAAQTLAALANRNSLDTSEIDDVVLGCVDPVGEAGGNIARAAVLQAGFAQSVAGVQINRFCASGLDAVNFAAAQVMCGAQEMAIAGGVESMSRIGLGASGGAWPTDPSVAIRSYYLPQGISADLIATRYGLSRETCDRYAVQSQTLTAQSWAKGHFFSSVIPVVDPLGLPVLERDEHMRPDSTMQSLASLEPSFSALGETYGFDAVAIQRYPELESIVHVHHAGNSSGIVDGAAAVLLGSERSDRKARARVVAFANIGSEPAIMLTGPEDVTRKVLRQAGMEIGDIDLFEINEAFAAVVLRYIQALELDPALVNVAGGAIAMGHPLGATGAMILGTVLDELERRNLSTALVTLCIGAGMGTATIIERV